MALATVTALVVPAGAIVDWFERGRDTYTANSRTSGALSDKLVLTFAFHQRATANDDQIDVSLENRSNRNLNLRVESRQFHGRIVVTPDGGAPREYLDSTFIGILMTSIWEVPARTLAPHSQITWTIPMGQLCDLHQQPLNREILNRATAYATLDEVAIVPRFGGYVSDNAKQVSSGAVISIQPPI